MATRLLTCSSCQASLTVDEARVTAPSCCSACGAPFAPPADLVLSEDLFPPPPRKLPPGVPQLSDVLEKSPQRGPAGPSADTETQQVPRPAERPAISGYEILEELGRGGMGLVYKARQTRLKRLVALKVVLAGSHAGPEHLARFRTETEAVARLQNPNIVQIYEVGEHEGRPFFSLEFVDGGSLATRLAGTPQDPRQAAQLVETLARAVAFAHQRGIVHRDLKPANVLLASGGRLASGGHLASGGCEPPDGAEPSGGSHPPLAQYIPKLTDFGLARQLEADSGQTRSGAILGTPSYMAPEQALGRTHEAGPAADLYALGAILYEMLTGRPPFRGATVLETLDQVRSRDPVAPRLLQPQLPRDLETICLKCLHKDPHKRYASAEALADDLARFQAGRPIQARPVRRAERLLKWARRQPKLAALTIVCGLALTGLFAGGAIYQYLLQKAVRQAEASAADARREEERANANYREARETINQMLDRLKDPRVASQPKLRELHRHHAKMPCASLDTSFSNRITPTPRYGSTWHSRTGRRESFKGNWAGWNRPWLTFARRWPCSGSSRPTTLTIPATAPTWRVCITASVASSAMPAKERSTSSKRYSSTTSLPALILTRASGEPNGPGATRAWARSIRTASVSGKRKRSTERL
jgi:serine/threonine protein kinase